MNIRLTLILLAASSLPLLGDAPITAEWNRVCFVSLQERLLVTTTDGDIVDGYCASVTVTELSLKTRDHGVVKIARDKLSKLQMYREKGHQLRLLFHGIRGGLRGSLHAIFTPEALVGIVGIPATLAWGAVSTTFCAIGDLAALPSGPRDIAISPSTRKP